MFSIVTSFIMNEGTFLRQERLEYMKIEDGTSGFKGRIGQNIPCSKEEIEEDLLEMLYHWWKDGKELRSLDISRELDISRRELNALVRKMVSHGYLCDTEREEPLRLTEFGKIQGAECAARHHCLTQFLQMVADMDEKEAQEDACRIEHLISKKGIAGISNFLKYGDTFERTIRYMDPRAVYSIGDYEISMGIYYMEKRHPCILAKEYYDFMPEVVLKVREDGCFFYLKPKSSAYPDNVTIWHKSRRAWNPVVRTQAGFKIPTENFDYTTSPAIPVMKGLGIIAFTKDGAYPEDVDCREFSVRL